MRVAPHEGNVQATTNVVARPLPAAVHARRGSRAPNDFKEQKPKQSKRRQHAAGFKDTRNAQPDVVDLRRVRSS
jgi:hypothetical protein